MSKLNNVVNYSWRCKLPFMKSWRVPGFSEIEVAAISKKKAIQIYNNVYKESCYDEYRKTFSDEIC